ncbi:MAG: tRNA (guanosine(46)-N7)-methyltransferase TrmB [Muribaculaceae bacterium]|uniref:tRNA (guanosine(46)-N7)-methyltransferase TrmB n=1 Tax=uncultured Duncaniella sp. TaxID=2768039 RepID=UPI000B243AF1|nr:tRNA (guanosine(46)-N7)-methyltransferase TrmB [uncultured Duncaniella sp.]MBJ2191023.1 tRNA (guanosine(46)-N7)-methyltransferase TrmB [Muribaculaceae bacterium]
MGKNKLKKFAEMETLGCVYQYPQSVLESKGDCPLRGNWAKEVFGNSNPIVLELGCGKGEYAVGMGKLYPDRNFIGIDIKGARMWTGAKEVDQLGLTNVAFLRTSIHLLPRFFAPGEVSEIWITFPDPQMKKVNKRLTGTHFLDIYRQVLASEGVIHLKTDSPFLFAYTTAMLDHNSIRPLHTTADLYNSDVNEIVPPIRTYYEQQWLGRGIPSKYIAWRLPGSDVALDEPQVDIEPDTYRSFGRGVLQSSADPFSETKNQEN